MTNADMALITKTGKASIIDLKEGPESVVLPNSLRKFTKNEL
jgi:hypothetical protein